MDAVIDIAREFKIYIPSVKEILEFRIPPLLNFKRSRGQGVEVQPGDKPAGDYTLEINRENFSVFYPGKTLAEPFMEIFNHYFYHLVKEKAAGEEISRLNVIIPLAFSMPFENLLHQGIEQKCDLQVYRDAEVYAAYYLCDSPDLPEIHHFAHQDEGAHVYGLWWNGESFDMTLFHYRENERPDIIDFANIKIKEEVMATLKLLINRHSTDRSKVFYFYEGEEFEIPGIAGTEESYLDKEIDIDESRSIKIRRMRKKNPPDNVLVKGIENLDKNPGTAPFFLFSPFIQEQSNTYRKINIDRDLNIAVDFDKKVPAEFFINFFIGPNSSNLIFLERVFISLGALLEKHIEFKGRLQRLPDQVKIDMMYKNIINVETALPLREVYRIAGE